MRNVKNAITILFAFLGFSGIYAQISVGVKIGANIADTRVNELIGNLTPEQTTNTGFTAGLVCDIPLKDALSFRPEINYIQKGFTVSKSFDVQVLGINMPLGAKARTRVNYIELPLLFKYSLGHEMAKVYAVAGPSIAYAASASLNPVATLILDFNLPGVKINLNDEIYQRWELSANVGAGGEVKAGGGKLFADARYNLGLTNMLNNPIVELKIKNQGFNFSAGYAYNF